MLPCFAYGCAHPCCRAWGFLCFLTILRPPSGSESTSSSGYSSPLGFPTFAMGSPLRGRGLFILDRNEGLVSPFGSGPLVSSWLDLTPVCGVSARPVPPGVLPDGLPCVRELRLSLAPSSVLSSPMLGFRVASATLAAGLGLSWVSCPSSASWGFVPRLVARLAPCSRWRPLTGWSSLTLRVLGGSWFSPLCSPGRRSASRSTYSALSPVSRLFWACSLLLRVRLRPLPDDSLGALWLPVRLLWSSLRLRVGEGSSLSAWSFPFRGLSPFSCLFLSGRPCWSRSLFPSLAPSWWWPCLLC